MTHRVDRIPLVTMSPGTTRGLMAHRFGTPGARPKVYLQAGIHADEIPGLLVLHHLIRRLAEADRAGAILGEVVVVPFANPIGLAQHVNGELLGRFELGGGGNFNRNFPDLSDAAADRLAGRLGADADANVAAVRAALVAALDEQPSGTDLEAQRLALMRLAIDADIVLDLHCDSEAVMHLFVGDDLWPDAADLSAQIGSRATLLALDSGGGPFDEAFSHPWHALAARFGDATPIPPACLSATIELRGTADVDDDMAAADADNLLRFLMRRGVVDGDPGPLPAPLCQATPLEGVDYIVAPAAGVIAFKKAPGDHVEAGEVVAELIDPAADDPAMARLALTSRVSGILFGRHVMKLARPGQKICKVAGAEPLPGRAGGNLLTD